MGQCGTSPRSGASVGLSPARSPRYTFVTGTLVLLATAGTTLVAAAGVQTLAGHTGGDTGPGAVGGGQASPRIVISQPAWPAGSGPAGIRPVAAFPPAALLRLGGDLPARTGPVALPVFARPLPGLAVVAGAATPVGRSTRGSKGPGPAGSGGSGAAGGTTTGHHHGGSGHHHGGSGHHHGGSGHGHGGSGHGHGGSGHHHGGSGHGPSCWPVRHVTGSAPVPPVRFERGPVRPCPVSSGSSAAVAGSSGGDRQAPPPVVDPGADPRPADAPTAARAR